MLFRALANVVVIAHFAFVLFVVFGGLLTYWRRRIIWIHVPVVVWAVLIEWIGWVCPLTPLENWLRRKGGELGYNVNFIERYIHPLLYPVGMTRFVQLMLGALVLGINLGIYGLLISRRHRSEGTANESNFADQYSDVTNRRAP